MKDTQTALMATLGRLFKDISALEVSIGEQKPETIALYMGKVINTYQKVDKEFVQDCKDFYTSILK